MKKTVLEALNIHKTFEGEEPAVVLKGLNFSIHQGESLAIMGRSGEGKSTLLHILSTLELPTQGSLYFEGNKLERSDFSLFRQEKIGFIFQTFNLLEDFTVLDNLLFPSLIARESKNEREKIKERAIGLLEQIQLLPKKGALAKHLSGGEKQRVAIARALIHNPSILFADEPSGNLDSHQADIIHHMLLDLVKKYNKSLVLVTHDTSLAALCDKILYLKEGLLWEKP